jgi:predicted MFS family arabinose efflux permease
MTPLELRASLSLASIFGLRLLGMFVILPVFAIYAEKLPGGDNLTLVGVAIGAYGLTQAILQIPFGWWSDRYGRKPVIYTGLAIFATGSFIAAAALNIYVVILGRILQGGGAISAAVMAMAADLTREEQRTKAMAMIGSTIGLAFAVSLVASPWLNRLIGVPGIFALTGVLALVAMFVVWRIVPNVAEISRSDRSGALKDFLGVLTDPQLGRLNIGVFTLHAVLMAIFIAIPFSLRDAGLPLAQHWKIYLPVMLGSFLLMMPAVVGRGRNRLRGYFVASVALLLIAHVALPWLAGNVPLLTVFLLLFFTPFNVLEALLPTLTSRMAPARNKGVAIGLYSSVQFFGTFCGAVLGGFAYGRWGLIGVVIVNTVLLAIWLVAALGMRPPAAASGLRSYTLPRLDAHAAALLAERALTLKGVRQARVVPEENTLCLEVDTDSFDEQNVLQLITAET